MEGFVVDILLSTYNGEDYIEEQIKSIISQSFSDWRLTIRDDGSSDNTLQLLSNFASQDSRIHLLPSDGRNLGPASAFIELLKHVDAPYFMFCDQDDVWLEDKVKITLDALKKMEEVPHLVHTDLAVVNEQLDLISPSFMKFQRFSPKDAESFGRMLMQNIIVGCTIGGNRKLLEASGLLSGTLPAGVIMHDWWLGLVAKAFGNITYINSQTILYRQHGRNTLGAPGSNFKRYIWLVFHAKPWAKAKAYLEKVSLQANSFMLHYENQLAKPDRDSLVQVSSIGKSWRVLGLIRCFSCGIRMHALDRNIALLISNIFSR